MPLALFIRYEFLIRAKWLVRIATWQPSTSQPPCASRSLGTPPDRGRGGWAGPPASHRPRAPRAAVSLLQLRAQQMLVDRVLAAARALLLLGDRPLRRQASKTGRRVEGAGGRARVPCIPCARRAGRRLAAPAPASPAGPRRTSSAGAEASSERSLARTLSRSVSVWGTSTALHASATFSLT